MKQKFYAEYVDKKLKLDDLKAFTSHVERIAEAGKKLIVTVEKIKKQRSNNQNNYYWGVVIRMLSDEIGYSDEEMHDALKWKFLQKQGKIPTTKSTSELSTVEYEDFLSKVRMWASADLGVYIPTPNEAENNFYF